MINKEHTYIRRRIEAIAGLLVLGVLLLAVRAVDLQWFQSEHLSNLAEKQRYRQFTTIAPRGPILDQKGRMLAESLQTPSLAAIADEVPSDRIAELARALGMSHKKLQRKLGKRKGFVWLARQIPPAVAANVMALNIPGVRQESEWQRYHPLGPETGHLLGFVGVDGRGLEGIERTWNKQLSGEAGLRQVRRDARGHSLPDGRWVRAPKAGQAITLTLDSSIQSVAYAALAEGVLSQNAKGGSVVVMRPKDGAILAMASWPGYNPNNFRHYHPSEWRNRAITDVFEPGSTLKPFTIAAALETGRWQPDTKIYCEKGSMKVADYTIHDDHPEEWLDVTGVLVRSSNIGSAKMALDIGARSLYEMMTKAGFGTRSGTGLSGESSGIVLPPERWGPVETANIAFGQGIAVTPLQLATAFSVLANDGLYMPPTLFANRLDQQTPTRIMSSTIAHQVSQMLEYATSTEGTGSKAVPSGYRVAGKTGTAQKPNPRGGYSKGKYDAVFAGFAPAYDPQVVIVVLVDEPKKSIYGGQVAAPIFRNIAENVLPYLGISAHNDGLGDHQTDEHDNGTSTWQTMPIAAEHSMIDAESVFGMSMREVRRFSAQRGLRLHVHGSGWVTRQKPTASSTLEHGETLEVWLNE
ncbi:peptidoglycan glycosyltransferase [Mariprofundus sp. EBB-1]|uniref:penicillin-binding transpeptidase domain-containing protein n=1 Tax=Mariprofundus sp. EBB-1 TaxID=2650971 RepID=UPI000EF1B578|nr:penicillin-binding transpeptidase domain-containing protein [Mariprofundus sp. EBB-1]RLL54995.1 peptidoglycan glycosyltransferase [Mariprofundus sp. EBB-1]